MDYENNEVEDAVRIESNNAIGTLRINGLFDYSSDRTIIDAFEKLRIWTAREITPRIVIQVIQTPGIGPAKVQRIIDVLTPLIQNSQDTVLVHQLDQVLVRIHGFENSVTEQRVTNLPVMLAKDETTVADIFSDMRQPGLLNAFRSAAVEKLSDLTPEKLVLVLRGRSIGIKRRDQILEILDDYAQRALLLTSPKIAATPVTVIAPLLTTTHRELSEEIERRNGIVYTTTCSDFLTSARYSVLRVLIHRQSTRDQNSVGQENLYGGLPTWIQAISRFLEADFGLSREQTMGELQAVSDQALIENINTYHALQQGKTFDLNAFEKTLLPNRAVSFRQGMIEGQSTTDIAKQLGLSRNRGYQSMAANDVAFSRYWQKNQLTLHLLLATKCESFNISEHYTPRLAKVVQKSLKDEDAVADLWFS
ncbi:hypothetical protein [Schleiferilactobacillus perolens]|uniref:Uncharacterized protein n=1 Tax=Schleiferilactobacillus perolens DSM 12744 TaxID=1423792 RepID=A0A0R1N334_9LACO|nr:hypothetical protein [Schleiferilactobacillus perolens]KRL14655.1 hypothetical protein FD09_GL000310 [Schleiferilactobacillus perolens DSM 12744]